MPPNVLLVVLDCVRARNTSLHGHLNDTTPFLREFAEDRATVYEQARTPGARSITGHASLFTGLHVEEHGLASADRKLKPGSTVFEGLRDEHGYATGVFSENVWITDVDIGLKEGFDRIDGPQNVFFPDALDPRSFVAHEGKGQYAEYLRRSLASDQPLKALANGVIGKVAADFPGLMPRTLNASTPGNVYVDRFLEWSGGVDGPWAACINLMDAHGPYEPTEEHNLWGDEGLVELERDAPDKWEHNCAGAPWWRREAREALYDGAIHQADAHLRRLVDALDERGELDDTLLVVTSDHGEGFGEPSRIRPGTRVAAHNVSVHEVILHVPLVVKFPGQSDGERVPDLVSLTRFPDAAMAAVRGEAGPDDFVSDTPVVASTFGLTMDDQLRARASQHCDDLSAFDAPLRAAYEHAGDGTVRKYVTWTSEAATLVVRDAQTSYKTSASGAAEVEAAFEDIEDAGILIEGSGVDALDDDVYDQLERLGYV